MPGGRPWEDAWRPPPPRPGRDILAEERLRPRRMWWPGNWLRGRAGAVFLVLFLAGAAGFAAWGKVDLHSFSPSPAERSGEVHPEAGRHLTPAEYAVGRRYGRPLFLGDGGLPMVRLDATDEVRELTPVEVRHRSTVPYVSSGYGGVVWTTGPRGWGIWWEDDPEREVLNSVSDFSRALWRDKQVEELSYAVDGVSLAMRFVGGMELFPWREGAGRPVYLITEDLMSRHPVSAYGVWAAVPGQWHCSEALEFDLSQGVTQGCPGPVYLSALEDAWVELGQVVYVMNGIGQMGVRMDAMDAESLYQSGLVISQAYRMIDLLEQVEQLDAALRHLSGESRAAGLPITAILDFG